MNTKHKTLPEPYVEVFIWWNGARRVARLDSTRKSFQLATFLVDTKAQYLVPSADIEHWEAIVGDNSHDALLEALKDARSTLHQEGYTSTQAIDAALAAAGH